MTGNIVRDLFYPADKFRTENQNIRFRKIDTVFDLICGIAEIERDRDCTGFEDAEIDRKPVQTVHQEDRDLVTLNDSAGNEKIRDTVCLFFKDAPGDLRAERHFISRLNQLEFLPGCQFWSLNLRIKFHKSDVVRKHMRVFFQKICDKHTIGPPCMC